MPKFRKKPVVISAVKWTGDNVKEIAEFLADAEVHLPPGSGARLLTAMNIAHFDLSVSPPDLRIPTLEGDHRATVGDWIIRGIKGECYPVKPDIFEATYEEVI